MDVHKNYLQVAVLDEKGKVLNNSRVDNDLAKVNEFFDSLHPNSKTNVGMESYGMWYKIYECLSKRHLDVRLSNPVKTRAIASAKIKTDKLDAVKLADLLRGGYIAECYVPNKRIMGLRDIVRHRAALVRMRTESLTMSLLLTQHKLIDQLKLMIKSEQTQTETPYADSNRI